MLFKVGYWSVDTKETKLGIEEFNIFVEVFKISLTRQKSAENTLKYKKLINVDGVAVIDEFKNKGISTFIYAYLVNKLGYTVLGHVS